MQKDIKVNKMNIEETTGIAIEEDGTDIMRNIMVQQGYIPRTCTLHGRVIFGLINRGEDPCKGCNENRTICKGREKDENYLATKIKGVTK